MPEPGRTQRHGRALGHVSSPSPRDGCAQEERIVAHSALAQSEHIAREARLAGDTGERGRAALPPRVGGTLDRRVFEGGRAAITPKIAQWNT